MSRVSSHGEGLIGPNAILQLLPILEQLGGAEHRTQLMARAGIRHIPDGTSMIPETEAARLHQQLRIEEPDKAPDLAWKAGTGTANYILKHRIPKPVQWVLKSLPAGPAAALLSRAIAKNAWTFVGSGQLTVLNPWTFAIKNNPLIAGETSNVCLCDWHAGVFSRLYQALVCHTAVCHETTCGAQSLGSLCQFEVRRAPHTLRHPEPVQNANETAP